MMYQPENLRRPDGIKDNFKSIQKHSEQIINGKSKTLENTYDEMQSFLKDLQELQLHNEGLERVLNKRQTEKNQLDETRKNERAAYEALSNKYQEIKKLLENSNSQNNQLSNMVEKMRENEKQLLQENERLRKSGSLSDRKSIQDCISHTTIENLEEELKFWKNEANKYAKLLTKADKNQDGHNENPSSSNSKKSIKKTSTVNRKFNSVLLRSKSVESSVKKNKETELSKLKHEKAQMKSLLNNLELQVTEVQSNIIKINEERQKYKDLYLESKQKLDHCQCICSSHDHRIEELTTINNQLNLERVRFTEQMDLLLRDQRQMEKSNQNLIMELNSVTSKYEVQIDELRLKNENSERENKELDKRSKNLRQNVHNLEEELSNFEEKMIQRDKNSTCQLKQIEALSDKLCIVEKELESKNSKVNELYQSINQKDEKLNNMLQNEKHNEKLTIDRENENKQSQEQIQQLTNEIQRQHSTFSAQIVKFENHLKNAEQIINSKIKLITSLELKMSNLEQENSKINEELLETKRMLNTKDHQFDVANNKYLEIQESRAFLEKHIRTLTNSGDGLQKEIINLNTIITEQKREIDSSHATIDRIKRNLDESQDCIESQHQSIKRLEQNIQSNDDEIRRLNSKINQMQQDKREKDSYIGSLVCVVEEKDRKLSDLQQNIDSGEDKIRDLSNRVNEFEDSILQSTSRGSALELEMDNLRNVNLRLKRQKEHLNIQLSERNVLIGQLEAQVNANGVGGNLKRFQIQKSSKTNEKNPITINHNHNLKNPQILQANEVHDSKSIQNSYNGFSNKFNVLPHYSSSEVI